MAQQTPPSVPTLPPPLPPDRSGVSSSLPDRADPRLFVLISIALLLLAALLLLVFILIFGRSGEMVGGESTRSAGLSGELDEVQIGSDAENESPASPENVTGNSKDAVAQEETLPESGETNIKEEPVEPDSTQARMNEPTEEQQAESEPSAGLAGSAGRNLGELEGDIEDNQGATELDQRSEAHDSVQANQDRFEGRNQVAEDEGNLPISESPTASEGGSKPKTLNASVTGGRSLIGGEAAAGHLTLSAEFNSHIVALRDEGLEIALLFDATSSMGPQIYQAKQKLRNIVSAVHGLVPNAAFTVAVYRDYDTIPAQGIRLTSDPEAIDQFVKNVRLMAGGDEPESVASGLFWLVKHNVFSKSAKRVLIIVGDAPPHRQEFAKCLRLVDAFCDSKDARVYTVTCNKLRPLREFVAISNRGNGEALSLAVNHSVVRELLVLSLGHEYRDEIDKMVITP